MRSERVLLVALILAGLATAACAQSLSGRVTVSGAHAGPVRDAAATPTGSHAFTVGDDGALKVWDLERQGLYRSYQVAAGPLTHVAHHPERDEIVVYASEGPRGGLIVAIDWRSGERLFEHRLQTGVTLLTYSPLGTYVVYAVPSAQSLGFLAAGRGTRMPFVDHGFGMVSFVQMGASERNIVTYLPARGELVYFAVQTGEELQRVATRARLEHVTAVDPDTRRLLAASTGQELLIIDNLTGETRASYPVSPIFGITFDPVSRSILVLTEQFGRRTTTAFTYTANTLRRSVYQPLGFPADATVVRNAGLTNTAGYVVGGQSGEVSLVAPGTGRVTVIGPSIVRPVADVALTPGALHLRFEDGAMTLSSDALDEGRRVLAAGFVRQSPLVLPPGPVRLASDGQNLLVFGDEQAPGTLWVGGAPGYPLEPLRQDDQQTPITRVRTTEAGPLLLFRDGRIVQLSRFAAVERFRYTAIGLQDAFWDPTAGLIVAKTRSSVFDSSLIIVDPLTGETVAPQTNAFLTTRVAYDPRSAALYSIGLVGSAASPSTELVRHSGSSFDRSETLRTDPRELGTAVLVWDSVTGNLLTTMDPTRVLRFDSRTSGAFEAAERLHRSLILGSQFAVARNADGTVTFWDRVSGRHLFDLYVFRDGWIVLTPAGAFVSSSRQVERYLTHLPAAGRRPDLNALRVTLPYAP